MRTHDDSLRLALGGMLSLCIAMGVGRFVYTPLLPVMASAEGLSASQTGLIASSNYAGYLIGALLAATAWLRGSRRTWLLVALFGSVVTTASMAVVDSYTAFLFVRFVAGLSSAWVMVFASALVMARLASAGRSSLAAAHFAGVGVGIVVASLLVTLAVGNGGSWRMAWLINGAAGLLGIHLIARLIPEGEAEVATSPTGPSGGSTSLVRLLAGYGLFGFGYVITATFIVQLVRSADFSLTAEAVVWMLVGAAAIPSIRIWSGAAGWFGNRRAIAIACIIEAVGVGASVLGSGLGALILAAVMLGGTFMGITYLGLVEARIRATGDPRKVVAAMTAAFGAGQIIGPGLAGILRDATGTFLWPTLLATVALLMAAMLIGGSPIARSRDTGTELA